jgi:hypothetical protein
MKFEVTNPKAWKAVNEKNIPMSHKIKVYEKLGGAYRLGEDGGEQVFNKMTELLKHKMNEEPIKETIKKGSIIIPYAMDKYGQFVVDKVFKNKDGETSYTGQFKKNGEKREFILHSKDKIVKEEYESSPEETIKGLTEMTMGQLERIGDYASMIADRMSKGQQLDSWMYSQITLAVDQLNSVHDAMDGTDGEKEPLKEGVSSKEMDSIKSAVEAASSFMGVGAELKKAGLRYTFATEPLAIYIVQPTANNKVAIINKRYASNPDFVVGDIAVGVMD